MLIDIISYFLYTLLKFSYFPVSSADASWLTCIAIEACHCHNHLQILILIFVLYLYMYSYHIVLYIHLQCDVWGCNEHTLTSISSHTLTHNFSRLSYNHITCKINVFEAKHILNKQKQYIFWWSLNTHGYPWSVTNLKLEGTIRFN